MHFRQALKTIGSYSGPIAKASPGLAHLRRRECVEEDGVPGVKLAEVAPARASTRDGNSNIRGKLLKSCWNRLTPCCTANFLSEKAAWMILARAPRSSTLT